eukprot:CAMPEP_0202818354 /NCGR_PEP_ID=MMETSP1389-20130828/8273_1 /ASSEMBLY_ACC=CAM_ASM_000865 /TAXON_ID=302021 /ORGANISM="Rhodomonas sp., Strain CCMP768" /LENGTH=611 /DNA_ID=CAMNT_0049490691 /DNA_START=20 /DNA_END=1855 /DNA_ORIENTATION=+
MTVSAMASIGSKVRASMDPDETEDSGGEEPGFSFSQKPKVPEQSFTLFSAPEDTNGILEKPNKTDRTDVTEAFAEVRTLLWREEWMKSQIELLSQQRDQMARSLEKVMQEKPPVLLAPPPARKRKLEGLSVNTNLPNGAAQSHTPRELIPFDLSNETEPDSGNASGCVRAVDWQAILGSRRRPLMQAIVPLESLHPLPHSPTQESRKRWRSSAAHCQLNRHKHQAEEGESAGRLDSKRSSLASARTAPHSSHPHPHPSSNRKTHAPARHLDAHSPAPDSPAPHKSGSVLKGGRSVVTPGGQKVVIKFNATRPSPSPAASRGGGAPSSPYTGAMGRYRNGSSRQGEPSTPVLSAHKKHRSMLSLATSRTSSPRMAPAATPGTPRGADWGIDDYVYGGPRTHAKIEIVKAKHIDTPQWHVIKRDEPKSASKKEQARQSRGLSVGSKYAKAKPHAQPAPTSHGGAGDGSSEENTDDETYNARHRPYEEQETKYRFPKQQQREQKHLEALHKEGGYVGADDSEQAYKLLWYRGDSSNSLDMDAANPRPASKQLTPTSARGATGSDADANSPRPVDGEVKDESARALGPSLSSEGEGRAGSGNRKNPPCDRVMVTG